MRYPLNQKRINSLEEFAAWMTVQQTSYNEDGLQYIGDFDTATDAPTSFPCIVVWANDSEYMCTSVEYVYPFGA